MASEKATWELSYRALRRRSSEDETKLTAHPRVEDVLDSRFHRPSFHTSHIEVISPSPGGGVRTGSLGEVVLQFEGRIGFEHGRKHRCERGVGGKGDVGGDFGRVAERKKEKEVQLV